MTTTIENYKGEQFEIETFFAQEFKGRGGWNINCEVSFKGEKKTFRHYTTDSMFIDQISDMKADASWDEIQKCYKEKAFDSLEESIIEWCEEINEAIKNSIQNLLLEVVSNNVVDYFANSTTKSDFVQKHIRPIVTVSEEQEEKISDILSEYNRDWDNADCDSEGATQEQDAELDVIIEECAKAIGLALR